MKIDYQHNLTNEEAYKRINNLLLDLQTKYSDKISNAEKSWNPEHTQMNYSMEIMGSKIKGRVHLRDCQITLEGKLPFMAKMFKGKIEHMVKEQLEDLFS